MARTRTPLRAWGAGRIAAMALIAAVLAAACSSPSPAPSPSPSTDPVAEAQARVDAAEQGVADSQAALETATSDFCGAAKTYIVAIDRYGKAFDDGAATVGDVQTLGADLAAPQGATRDSAQAVLAARDALDAANQELVDARQALAEAKAAAKGKTNTPTANTTTSPPPPLPPTGSIDRVQQAEADFESAGASITPETTLADATETFNAAALSLEMAWLNLFAEAGCLTDEQSEQAVAAVGDYTTVLQKDLAAAGYDPGATDGVYGPRTVAAVEELQKDSDLPVTGFVDAATAKALDAALQAKGAEAAALASTQTASVQTTLKLTGFWTGPIDGNWTPELTAALKKFQKYLGVKPTGAVDAATLAALEDALGALKEQPPPAPGASPTAIPSATSQAPATTEPSPTEPPTSG